MLALYAAHPQLSRAEGAAEAVYELMRTGRLPRDEYVRRMRELERISPLSACYATWMLLRTMPDSEEKAFHWKVMVGRLRDALNDSASLR